MRVVWRRAIPGTTCHLAEARAGQNRALRVAQAVPGGEALGTKMGDAHPEHAPEGLVSPAISWGTLGAHVVAADYFIGHRARLARAGWGGSGGVGVRSLTESKCRSKIW